MSLVLCRGCERHIRGHELACPFCGAAHEPEVRVLPPFRATSRAAVLFFTAGSLVACGKKPADPEPVIDVAPIASASASVSVTPDEDHDAAVAAMKEKLRDGGPHAVSVYGPAPINSNAKKK